MIKNTLVALDGSPCAEDARRYAVALCLKLRAQLSAVHVVDSRLFALPPAVAGQASALGVFPAPTSHDIHQILTRRGEACLAEAAARSEAEGLPLAETTLVPGVPAQILAELQARAELLVLGRFGEHAEADAAMTGSTTDRVVRRACRPCLVVPPSPPPPDRILVALDGSPHSFRAVHVASELANALSSPLVLLAVAEHPDRCGEAQNLAAETHRIARAHECAAATFVAEGAPAPQILETAARTSSTLLVLGSHGHGWIYDRLIGNTAAHILAHSPLPLLLVR